MYREVTMVELKEVLRLWREGLPKKRLAAQLGLDPKTVRRYPAVATATGLRPYAGRVSDEEVRDVLLALHLIQAADLSLNKPAALTLTSPAARPPEPCGRQPVLEAMMPPL
jgi:hypothetical protein